MSRYGSNGQKIFRLINARCEAEGITIKEFEKRAGLSNGYVRKLSLGNEPSAEKIAIIAKELGISSDSLLGGLSSFNNGKKSSGVKIPLLGKVAAGIPIEAVENLIGEEEISERLAASGKYFALLIKGDSMAPDIQNGDKVIVRQQPILESGQIAVVLVNGDEAVCKEFRKTSTGVMLVSRNPNYEPMVFTYEDVKTKPIKIVGRVVEVRREL